MVDCKPWNQYKTKSCAVFNRSILLTCLHFTYYQLKSEYIQDWTILIFVQKKKTILIYVVLASWPRRLTWLLTLSSSPDKKLNCKFNLAVALCHKIKRTSICTQVYFFLRHQASSVWYNRQLFVRLHTKYELVTF